MQEEEVLSRVKPGEALPSVAWQANQQSRTFGEPEDKEPDHFRTVPVPVLFLTSVWANGTIPCS